MLLKEFGGSILYKSLDGEVDYKHPSFPIHISQNSLILPNNKNSDPFEWAEKCVSEFKNTKAYVLIPGTRFDMSGTRHGRSGGWYDRFLSKIPSSWLRIGIMDKSQVSDSKLLKQKWDEPVDWIIIQDASEWSIHKTQAR